MQDKKAFAEMISTLAVLYDKDVSPVLRKIYWEVLSTYSDEEVKFMFNQAVANCKFFPKPSELIQFIKTIKQEQKQLEEITSLEAWGMVMSGLEYGRVPEDEKIQQAIRRLGGWDYLKGKTYDDLHWLEKRFVEHYNQIEESQKYGELDWPNSKLLTGDISTK